MKRILPIFLALMLFVGCGNKNADEDQSTAPQAELHNHSIYVSGSSVEQSTAGSVKLYDPADTVHRIAQTGDRILLLRQEEDTKLTAVGSDGVVAASLTIPGELPVYQATNSGFVYYDTDNNHAVFLDPQLQETQRHQLPDEIMGMPAFSADGGQIFYCVGQDIRALDTQMNITRPVRSHSVKSQTLLGCYLNGSVLAVETRDDEDVRSVIYVSAQTGELLSNDEAVLTIDSNDSAYVATRKDGIITQYIYAVKENAPQQMNVAEAYAAGVAALNGVVGYEVLESGLSLSFYDLTSGKKTGAVQLDGVSKPVQIMGDRWTGCVWILTQDNKLLRWDPDLSAMNDDTNYTSPVYSAAAPDEAGLEALQKRVEAMNRTYGVTLRIWQSAVKSNAGHDLEPEYQTKAIEQTLNQIEAIFKEFPDKFLYKSVNRTIRICVVRSVGDEITSAYYWFDKDPFIVLSAGVDVRREFLSAFAYVLDIHVLGNSPMIDLWNDFNPEGFTYGLAEYDSAWLEGDTRAFADEAAMASVIDDRASVFYQAMQKDNAEMFQSEIMQAKLLQLCKAIRDAWRLEQKTDTYLWEQYLEKSIAYVEQ